MAQLTGSALPTTGGQIESKPQQSPIGGGTEYVSMTLGRRDAAAERTGTYSQRVMETYSVPPQFNPLEAAVTRVRDRRVESNVDET
jgi:hypothetical protein